jgi:uncharacterized membrane protein
MDDAAERYLEELRRNLRPLPEDERSEALREIESHIAEGQADERPTAAVLAGLGDAKTLARAYVVDYHLRRVPREGALGSVGRFVLSSVFVSGTGLLSLIVVPLLALLTSIAGLMAVTTPVLGILRTFGVSGIEMGVSGAGRCRSCGASLHPWCSPGCLPSWHGLGTSSWEDIRGWYWQAIAGYYRSALFLGRVQLPMTMIRCEFASTHLL